ncbi:putative reverse transcriptase domain-containing protein [Tanacetum coccineum]
MYIDYRELHKLTTKNLLRINGLYDQLQVSRYFSKIDIRSGYHQLRVHGEELYNQDLELGAVVFAFKTWRHYLYGAKSVIYANHKSLQHIIDQKELNVCQQNGFNCVKDKILAAPCEASKVENVTAEMMCGLDQLMERKEDEVREDYKMEKLARLYIDKIVAGHGMPVSIISDRDGRFTSRVLANITESLRDVIGYEYGLSSSKGWTKIFLYHSSIRCAPFGELYGRKCRSPVLWAKIRESRLIGLELVQETTNKLVLIKEKLKAARDRQKSYADNRRKLLEFEVADQVLLKVSPWKGVVDKTLRFVEEPVEIIDREVKSLKRSRIPIVKVHWNLKRGHEDFIKSKYPHLLVEQAIVRSTK